MSYCRWSCDDFQSDVYAYEHCDGFFQIHIASKKRVFKEPLPVPVEYSPKNKAAWLLRIIKVAKILDRSDLVPIGFPFDGQSFSCATEEEMFDKLRELKQVGYRVPEHVLK
jgi:hypothetical protein